MRQDADGFIPCLLFLLVCVCLPHNLLVASPSTSSFSCHPDQRDALLRFIHSFSITDPGYSLVYPFPIDCYSQNAPYPKVASWREDRDCCSWDGITCNNSTGDVVGLDLTCAMLHGSINSGSPLFSLRHLRGLSLHGNDLLGSTVPHEIGVFTQLEYLDLSYSNISGILPTEISLLSKLISLDLSYNDGLEMLEHTMRMLIQNLTQIEELNLGYVYMSTVTPTSFMNLSSSLISLKLSECWLGGKFPEFILGLPNLRIIDLSWNHELIGTLPESKWSPSLDYLSLLGCSFTGAIPNSIGNLSRLTYLDLSENNFTIDLGILSTLENLQSLSLYGISVSGEDANHDFSLPKLQFLDMRSCNLSKFPSFLSRSKELRTLFLGGNNIREIPGWLWSIGIDTLEELNLEDNIIMGSVPPSVCRLTSLSSVDLSGNNLTSVMPWCLGNLTKLYRLSLSYNSLRGPLPLSLANCTSLMVLDVSYNMLEGQLPMPPAFIQDFQVRNNRFSGSIPPSICQLTSLPSIVLNQNNFTGVIPRCLGNLTKLQELHLSNNSLKGPPPPSLANCTSLMVLDVSYNMLEGTLPMPPAFIQEFQIKNNRFGGSIPQSMCHLTSLYCLDMSQNDLTGAIPQCLGNHTELSDLSLSNNSLSGPLPPSLANCTFLWHLDVGYNSISGAPPSWLSTTSIYDLNLKANNFGGRWPRDIFLQSASLEFIDLSDNKVEGPLPLPSYITGTYSVSNNHFSGEISSVICNATDLRLLDLSYNSLTGVLPDCLKNITGGLVFLNLQANEFQGQIPEIFQKGSMLTSLALSRNQFVGSLPRSLSNCKQLEAFDVSNNNIVDSFPNWLGDLPLKVLSLKSNNFHGQVIFSMETHNFSQVRILDLSNNNFEGNIADKFIVELLGMHQDNSYGFSDQYMFSDNNNGSRRYYSVMIDLKGVEMEMVKINVRFAMLDLSNNHFHGEIPESIGLLKSLRGLNFSHNRFTGSIPPSIGNLTNLESLDLSSNHLMGEIPKELVKLSSLGFLNLSSNNLTGPIPLGGHIDTFSNSSFQGNPGLCGIPLTRLCSPGVQPSSEGKDDGKKEGGGWLEWKYVALGFGSGMGMGITLGYMVLEIGRPIWLVWLVMRLEASYRKMSKRKGSQRRNGRR